MKFILRFIFLHCFFVFSFHSAISDIIDIENSAIKTIISEVNGHRKDHGVNLLTLVPEGYADDDKNMNEGWLLYENKTAESENFISILVTKEVFSIVSDWYYEVYEIKDWNNVEMYKNSIERFARMIWKGSKYMKVELNLRVNQNGAIEADIKCYFYPSPRKGTYEDNVLPPIGPLKPTIKTTRKPKPTKTTTKSPAVGWEDYVNLDINLSGRDYFFKREGDAMFFNVVVLPSLSTFGLFLMLSSFFLAISCCSYCTFAWCTMGLARKPSKKEIGDMYHEYFDKPPETSSEQA